MMLLCEACGACTDPTYRAEDGEHVRWSCPECGSEEVRYATV